MRTQKYLSTEQNLTLNCLNVVFNKETLLLHKTPYSKELYEKYKSDPRFFIYRFYDDLYHDSLYLWELCSIDEKLPMEFEQVEVNINEHSPIFSKIVERAIVHFLRENGRNIYLNKYSSLWEVELKKEPPQTFHALILQPTLVFSVVNLYSISLQKQVFVLTVRKRLKPIFSEDDGNIKNNLSKIKGLKRNHKGKIIPNTENQYRYLESVRQKQSFLAFKSQSESVTSQYKFISECTKRFKKIESKLYFPDGLSISNFQPVNLPGKSFNYSEIRTPNYYYYNERVNSKKYNQALPVSKPYSFDRFKDRKITFVVICPARFKTDMDKFMDNVKDRLELLFQLSNVHFDIKLVNSNETYLKVLDGINLRNYDLTIVLLPNQVKEDVNSKSLHYSIKAKLSNQECVSQHLSVRTLRRSDKIVIDNFALNVYSKLGGVARTVEKSQDDITELVIGIGSTIDDTGERIIGFANVFDYNGLYLLGDCRQVSTQKDYKKDLEHYIVDILKLAFKKKGISEGDVVQLSFHLNKEAGKRHELKSIEDALMRFNNYNIQYSLTHVSLYHNYRFTSGIEYNFPNSGTFISISSRQVLLHLGGNTTPILIRLDKRSTYNDIFKITQQIYYFTHLSYHSFIPDRKPVTIKYSNLIAKKAHRLKQIPNWDSSMLDKLNGIPWFI